MSDILSWSDNMEQVFNDAVVRPVMEHPGTDFSEDMRMGYPFDVVRDEVIAKGLADFTTGHTHAQYGPLSADEKALLYTFVNFKKHFYACRQTYETHRAELTKWSRLNAAPSVVDVGCGPGTAGLALADTLPGANWRYFGIDIAPAMRALADRLWSGARATGLLGPLGSVSTFGSWTECGPDVVPRSSPLLIVCSYLFANSSLNTAVLRGLAAWVGSVCGVAERPVALLVYLNSTNPYANTNYEYFKALMGLDPQAHQPTRGEVQYRKSRRGASTGSDVFLHELLILKRAT